MITVALPVLLSEGIAWLAMESLCAQVVKSDFEVIIVEEQRAGMCGAEYFEAYRDRLAAAGCIRLSYTPIHRKIALSQKWWMISAMADPRSEVFILQAADCYSEPHRLQTALDAIRANHDWVHSPLGVFFHLQQQQHILYDARTTKYPTHLNMAIRMELARAINPGMKKKGVDGYLYRECTRVRKGQLRIYKDTSDNWKKGLDTHGLNNLSMKRQQYFQKVAAPFRATNLSIEQILPPAICERLRGISSLNKKAA